MGTHMGHTLAYGSIHTMLLCKNTLSYKHTHTHISLSVYLSIYVHIYFYLHIYKAPQKEGAGIALLVRASDLWSKGFEFNPSRSGRRIFFSRVSFVCWLLFGVHSTLVLPQWHVKDPGHSAKSAVGRLHLNTHTPLTQWSRSGLTMLLSRQSVETYQETSSRWTRQGALCHSRLSSLNQCGLILA